MFDRTATTTIVVAAAHRAGNFADYAATTVATVSKVKITVDDGCDGGRNTVTASTVTITTTTTAAAVATIALRNEDAVTGGGRS